ncbi:unnamed protein product [Adineta steineri]|uniref:Prenylcysteine lyase domain-containing protein n=1 Tax=Adineta steineri TaxID=433720 RepID=A0A815B1D3_9BILA|nr:unnamed protein product [Adineta steineri]CAF1552351.1 unnamed protein product [Adineta steineri]
MNKWKWIVGTIIAVVLLIFAFIVGFKLGHRIRHIAIIGAGAAGSSAAFFLHKQLLTLGDRDKVEITVYEKESKVGGRAALIHPYNDSKYDPAEIGASIYASVNLHLVRAIEQFGLNPAYRIIDDNHVSYLYNGKTILVDMDNVSSRYNLLSLTRLNMLTETSVHHFLRLYQRNFQLLNGPFRTVAAYVKAIDLKPQLNESGFRFLVNNGVDEMTVNEFVDSLTQGTYGQQVTQLHAVMTIIAMAGRGQSIKGGNYRIFGNHFKSLFSDVRDKITKVDYVQQHVTLFTTNATHLGSSYMKMNIPISLLVTRYRERQNSTNNLNLNLDVESMHFSTLLYPRNERLVKLFSPNYLDDSKLVEIVGSRANIGWIYRKMWYAYPRAPPRNDTIFPPINPDKGLYYVNAFESFISTMETQCVAAHNIIRLFLIDFGYDEKVATLADDYWIDTAI